MIDIGRGLSCGSDDINVEIGELAFAESSPVATASVQAAWSFCVSCFLVHNDGFCSFDHYL
jgi:hypothetical protein